MIEFDLARTFWSCNPQYKGYDPFQELYKNDDSYNKEKSSKIAWAAASFCSINSECVNLEVDDRKKFIEASILKVPGNWKRHEKIISEMIAVINKLEETPAQRQMKEWNRVMDEKNEYMKLLSYKTHGKQLEEMLASNGKLMAEYDRIMKMLSVEAVSEKTRGDSRESILEQGLLDLDNASK